MDDVTFLERQSKPGWLLPYLLALDSATLDLTGMTKQERRAANIQDTAPLSFSGPCRWAYWLWILEHNDLPNDAIPRVDFDNQPRPQDAKAVQDWLQYAVRRHYSWYDEAWLWLTKWLLYGFGFTGMDVERDVARIPEDVKVQWYKQVNLANLLNSPCDWPAFVLQSGLQDDKRTASPWSKSTGFYSTPMNVCAMMTALTFDTSDKLTDTRVLTVSDPCVGTGSMLLTASNYSLRLFGQDIVHSLCLCAILNGYLWMPWLVIMPAATAALLQAHADTLNRMRAMRDFMVHPGDGNGYQPQESLPVGVAITTDAHTAALDEQRRASARAFHEAARKGELEQMKLMG